LRSIETSPSFVAMTSPKIETERTTIFLPARDDAERLRDYHRRNAHHLAKWSPPRPPDFETIEYWHRKIEIFEQGFEDGRSAHLVATLRDRPADLVATCALSEIVRGAWQACLLGYGIDHAHEGRGLMREIVKAVVGYAFEDLALHRVMANYQPTNARSGALLKSLGFAVEGYARDYLFIDGAWRDHVLTALTNHAVHSPPPEDGASEGVDGDA
jgi:ribosomal-protein-alanine N-acetyltransferase